MKVNELMIGDWVLLWNKPQRVNYINLDDGERIGTDKQYLAQIVEAFEPISLTAEILEKNGFVRVDVGYRLKELYLTLSCSSCDDNPKVFWLGISDLECRVEYVHQLQHALRLCGIDKEIVL